MALGTGFVKVRQVAIALVLGILVIPASSIAARRQSREAPGAALEGAVERIDGDAAVLDLGGLDGIARGDRVVFWQDVNGTRVKIGVARVTRVSDADCRVGLRRLGAGLVRAGDVAIAYPSGWAGQDEQPGVPSSSDQAASAFEDPDDVQPIVVSPQLRAPARRRPVASLPIVGPGLRVAHDPASRIREGDSLQVSLVVSSQPPLAAVSLHVRQGKGGEWADIALDRTGDEGWTATIPGSEVHAGNLAYYIRGSYDDGRSVPLFAGSRNPWKVIVDPKEPPKIGRRAGVQGFFEWQEFYVQDSKRDTYWRAEVGFEYRIHRGALHVLRAGFGGIEGIGGDLADVENKAFNNLPHRAIGYGWLETVLRFGKYVRWTPRLMLGGVGVFSGRALSGQTTFQRGELTGGLSSLLEFGPEDLFVIGLKGSFLVPVGTEVLLGAMVHVGKGFQTGLSVGATSFPVHANWAGQLNLMGGWHGVDWMSIDLKLSVNVRSLEHAGLGGGLGLSFWW